MKTFEKYVETILQSVSENNLTNATGATNTDLSTQAIANLNKYRDVLQFFADKSQNRDVTKYSNNQSFNNLLTQAQRDGIVGADQNGQLQVTDAIIDHINNNIDTTGPLAGLQGQLVKPDATQTNQITQANKTANTQAKQSLAKAQSQQRTGSVNKGNPTSTTVNPQTINPYRK